MNVKRKDKRKTLFIELYLKHKNIPDVYEAFLKKKIDVNIRTLYRYKNDPDVFGIISHRMGEPTKTEAVMEVANIMRSDKVIKAAKNKLDAVNVLSKMMGFNAPEKVDVNHNVSFADAILEARQRIK